MQSSSDYFRAGAFYSSRSAKTGVSVMPVRRGAAPIPFYILQRFLLLFFTTVVTEAGGDA